MDKWMPTYYVDDHINDFGSVYKLVFATRYLAVHFNYTAH